MSRRDNRGRAAGPGGRAGAGGRVRRLHLPHLPAPPGDHGPTIARLVQQGTIRFNYHPLALLLQNGQDPAQAANAALCAGDSSAADFWKLHEALFANQELEGAGRWTAQFMVRFGHQHGISGSTYDQCVTSGTYVGFVNRITQQAQQRGVNATPTIFINGQLQRDPVVITSPSAFEAAVTHADQAAHR